MSTTTVSTVNNNRTNRFISNQYQFGIPFSYWKSYNIYPFIQPKYKNLKQELLQNKIYSINIINFLNIYKKAIKLYLKIETILGFNGDKNTAFAKYKQNWNNYCNIKYKQKISLSHLLSILFYTDLSILPMKMKIVCCKKLNINENNKIIKKRHYEYVNWLKLMAETIIFYGNNLSQNDNLYHGLSNKFLFKQFIAKFHIPTSTTSDKCQAKCFAKDNGIILQFTGLEYIGDPYFYTKSISKYSHENEYLFFKAELNIINIYIFNDNNNIINIKPLSLFQSILNGSIIIHKYINNNKQFNKIQKLLNKYLDLFLINKDNDYNLQLLKYFWYQNNKKIYINQQELKTKITLNTLRQKFILQNKDKTFKKYSNFLLKLKIKNNIIPVFIKSNYFKWSPSITQFKQFKTKKRFKLISKVMKCYDNTLFYCQMNLNNNLIKMSLILYKLPNNQISKLISCDFFCKQMNIYYIRFHQQLLTLNKNIKKENSRITAYFDFNLLTFVNSKLDWQISIQF